MAAPGGPAEMPLLTCEAHCVLGKAGMIDIAKCKGPTEIARIAVNEATQTPVPGQDPLPVQEMVAGYSFMCEHPGGHGKFNFVLMSAFEDQ